MKSYEKDNNKKQEERWGGGHSSCIYFLSYYKGAGFARVEQYGPGERAHRGVSVKAARQAHVELDHVRRELGVPGIACARVVHCELQALPLH